MISHEDLVRLWGEANIIRFSVDPKAVTLPADAVNVLGEVGLPRRVDPLFEVTHLAMISVPGQSDLCCRFGSDFGTDLCISTTGEVESFSVNGKYSPRFVNTSLALFVEFLVRVSAERKRFPDLGDEEIDQIVAALEARLRLLPRAWRPVHQLPVSWLLCY